MELNDGASITMEINGTTTVYAGSIINFDMPINGTDHEDEKTDKYYSGRYLIQSTRHMFDQKNKRHTIMMNLVKDSLNSMRALPAARNDANSLLFNFIGCLNQSA